MSDKLLFHMDLSNKYTFILLHMNLVNKCTFIPFHVDFSNKYTFIHCPSKDLNILKIYSVIHKQVYESAHRGLIMLMKRQNIRVIC